MCGIAGFWGKGDESVMRAMTEALHHRGPDFTGTFFDPKILEYAIKSRLLISNNLK
jgi:asparagine synthase (glutamine-hydrolysing)